MRIIRDVTTLFLLLSIIGGLLVFTAILPTTGCNRNEVVSDDGTMNLDSAIDLTNSLQPIPNREFTPSQEDRSGILNPVQIQESGYQETDLVRARTDSGTNTRQDITIDENGGWFADETQVNVTNIRRLYALNGTFDVGVDPWAYSIYDSSGGANTQNAVYDSANGYVITENIGEYESKPPLGIRYTHYYSCEILWGQIISNTPTTQNFSLSFDFKYASGPLDPQGNDLNPLNGDPELVIYINNVQYYMSLLTLDSHDSWYRINDFQVYVPGAPPAFKLEVGLLIEYTNLVVYADSDYDDDGYPDGAGNAQNITLFLDNVEFRGVNPIESTSVELIFHAGAASTAITGTVGGGLATLTNPSFWTTNPLHIEVTANTSVIFDYFVTTQFHRITNTSWTTNPTKHGVSYSIASGESASLVFYTYVAPPSVYQNMTFRISFPLDWENVTIWDPLRNDITGLCVIAPASIHVPNSVLDRVGWWEIEAEAHNYVKSTSTQLLDESSWTETTKFSTNNVTRTQVEIGTTSVTPEQGSPVNMTWFLPNGTEWTTESITSMIDGVANSSSWVLGGVNTTAGEWKIYVIWTNGTEIGYDVILFDMYHRALATVSYPIIESDHGLLISNLVTLLDTDNGKYLLDDSVSIVANWSSSAVTFSPNFAKKWWEADFDTNLVSGGQYTVIINVSRPYFDDVSCQFIVILTYTATMELPSIGPYPIEIGLNELYLIEIQYELSNGTGIEDASISMSYSGPSSGIVEGAQTDLGLGSYTLEISGVLSGEYQIKVTVSKNHYEEISKSFTLVVGETGTSFTSLNGSAGLIRIGLDFSMVLNYCNSTGDGLSGATVAIIDVTPSLGLTIGSVVDESSGNYSVVLTPTISQTYSVVIRANLTNHETQFVTFTLLVIDVQTSLSSSASGATISMDQLYVLQLAYEDQESNPISGATITLATEPSDLGYSVLDIGGGLYNITLVPSVNEPRSFQLSFRANKANYQTSSIAFSLFVQEIPTDIVVTTGEVSETILFMEKYCIEIAYVRTDTNERVTSADIAPVASPSDGIEWIIEEIGNIYCITFTTTKTGLWQITVTANKTTYVRNNIQLELETRQIDTSLNDITLVESLVYGRTYNFTFNYQLYNNSHVRDADVTPTGTGSTWITVVEGSNGEYRLSLTPQSTGGFEIAIEFSRTGFVSQVTLLSFNVQPVRISVVDIQGLTGLEGQLATLSLRLVEADTGNPVSGATIAYQLIVDLVPGSTDLLLESEFTNGQYGASFAMPGADSEIKIRIYIELQSHVLADNSEFFEADVNPTVSEITALTRTLEQYMPFILLAGAVSVSYAGRKSYIRKKRKENIEALAIKRRFDDVRNMLGVVVLHRVSGIPVYSRMIRGGFDDSLISAFITAISQFRREFDVDQKEWVITPISDIIMAVRTQNLVCAFITLGSPTPTQEERMIQFARAVGFVFDSDFEDAPILTIDELSEKRFDDLFNEMLDMHLHRRHKIVSTGKIPKGPRCLSKAIDELKKIGAFNLEEMANRMATCGIEEARVYKIIMDAIEHKDLIPVDDIDSIPDDKSSPSMDALIDGVTEPTDKDEMKSSDIDDLSKRDIE